MIKTLVYFAGTAYPTNCYELTAEWPGGMLGNFHLMPNENVNRWDTTVTLKGAFDSFQVFNGDNAQCSGQVCTFADKGWNGFIGAGNTYQLEFMLLFSGPTPDDIPVARRKIITMSLRVKEGEPRESLPKADVYLERRAWFRGSNRALLVHARQGSLLYLTP